MSPSSRRLPAPAAKRGRRRESAFTLLELLVVLAIIAALASVVAPAVFQNVGSAKVSAVKSQLEILELALAQYRLDNDTYPTAEQGLNALRTRPTVPGSDGELPRNWRGPYLMREVPSDPWGQAFIFIVPGIANPASYDLYSLGRDRRVGGTGEDADITSWGGPVTAVSGGTVGGTPP